MNTTREGPMNDIYRVTLYVELDAASPREAAEQAREIMRDPHRHGITESYDVQRYDENTELGAARHINLELPAPAPSSKTANTGPRLNSTGSIRPSADGQTMKRDTP